MGLRILIARRGSLRSRDTAWVSPQHERVNPSFHRPDMTVSLELRRSIRYYSGIQVVSGAFGAVTLRTC